MQKHDASPLTDFIEYPPEEMLSRSADFYQNIKRRHSIRKFSDKAVDKTIIENCLKSAGTAPSGANHQPWHFVAVSSPEIKQQIREQAEMQGFRSPFLWARKKITRAPTRHKPRRALVINQCPNQISTDLQASIILCSGPYGNPVMFSALVSPITSISCSR